MPDPEQVYALAPTISATPLAQSPDSTPLNEEAHHFSISSPEPHMKPPPPPTLVHGSLLLAQVFFGLGSVVGALGLPTMNPLTFALYREIMAGSILLGASVYEYRRLQWGNDKDEKEHAAATAGLSWWRHHRGQFIALGLFIFGNQAGCIIGLKLAGPVIAAVWQPSQPIMTAAISMALGWEPTSAYRIGGVAAAFVGCAAMVILSSSSGSSDDDGGDDVNDEGHGGIVMVVRHLSGHAFFFINCLCTSLYVLMSKEPLRFYSPLKVTALSYNIASFFMLISALLSSLSGAISSFLCPECVEGIWHIPPSAFWALAYFVLFNSVGAYALLTWANRHVTGTLVMGYTVLQPVTAAILTALLVGVRVYPSCDDMTEPGPCLDPPGWESLCGMAGIFVGLYFIITTEPSTAVSMETSPEEGGEASSGSIEAVGGLYQSVSARD